MGANVPSLRARPQQRAPRALVYAIVAIVVISTGVMIAQLIVNSSTIARLERSLAVAHALARTDGTPIPVVGAVPIHSEEQVALKVMRTLNRLETASP